MTAVVSREHARATCLTGAAGALLLVIACLMMIVAAPAHGGRLHGFAKPSGVQLTSDACHQLTSRSDSATVRACRTGPATESIRAGAF